MPCGASALPQNARTRVTALPLLNGLCCRPISARCPARPRRRAPLVQIPAPDPPAARLAPGAAPGLRRD